ncbi:hypothetical protein PsorP6_008865 [Peronosclerospora sorghi]|uniref:Uncharacterized protein n=1 Tax=Peronosclerospora sorghi TaxID=230839 RepID=A0ACC0W086_9STRA|nr:hypothetical protein PsorP6_008865 [Peronosclerospora sorghi]
MHLEKLDSQQLLADTDAVLQSHSTEKHTGRPRHPTKRDVAREREGLRRDAYRQRLKLERKSLRLLDRVEKKRKDLETLEMGASDSLALGAWRAIAMRQNEDRRQKEAFKKNLVAAVTQRVRSIQDLEHVVRKRVRVVQNLATIDELDFLEKKPRVEDKAKLLYTTYFQHLDALYGKEDEVFATVGLKPTPGGILSGQRTV